MPGIFAVAGTYIARALVAVGLYNVVDWFDDEDDVSVIDNTNYTLIGIVGVFSAIFIWDKWSNRPISKRYHRKHMRPR